MGKKYFDHYLQLIPESDHANIWKEINKSTSFGTFTKLAKKIGISNDILDAGVLESFQFRQKDFPSGAKGASKTYNTPRGLYGEIEITLTKPFEMQATPVTQLQWAMVMVMGSNSSYAFKSRRRIIINDKQIEIDINRPVNYVSFKDIEVFIRKLNKLQNQYIYRLPTAAEWGYAVRAGTKSKYSFGNSSRDLSLYAWFGYANSSMVSKKIFPVAKLRSNQYGLYDMYGNISEWTSDLYGRTLLQDAIDPIGASTGAKGVIRGGSVIDSADSLSFDRSYQRFHRGNVGAFQGFRLVRSKRRKIFF